MSTEDIRQLVKRRYAMFAERGSGQGSCCCPTEVTGFAAEHGLYSQEELAMIPKTSLSLSRGCGNPAGFANLQRGEVVVDFGCGAGIDVILAAHKVGPSGKVVGVDFAPEMIHRARETVAQAKVPASVELVCSDLDQLDLPDGCADVVTSNCVINLCPDKDAVYREAFRILKVGGRLAISDIILLKKIATERKERLQSTWSGCLGGTIDEESYFETVGQAGFTQIIVVARHSLSPTELEDMACCPGPEFTPAPEQEDLAAVQGKVVSIKFTAKKERTLRS